MNMFYKALKRTSQPKNEGVLKEETLPFEEIVYNKGYPVEIHHVYTEDGYLLRLYRIPGGKKETDYHNKLKPPVFFQHGIYDSADCWVCNSEENCFSLILANLGYDIWIGNSRGNKYSKFHREYSANSKEFWAFSFDEMGRYDLPAELEYVKKTNKSNEKIIYFGHSQGTTQLFSGLTYNLDYFKSRIKLFIALAPVVTMNHVDSKIIRLANFIKAEKVLRSLDVHQFMPETPQTVSLNLFMIKKFPRLVHFFIDLTTDKNSLNSNDPERMKVLYGHYPSGGSLKSMVHFFQIFRNKKFTYFDYGLEANMAIYKQPTPKEYLIENINDFPIVLVVGKEDRITPKGDVDELRRRLNSNVINFLEIDGLGHTGFLVGKDVSWFKNDILKVIKSISSSNPDIKEDMNNNNDVNDKKLKSSDEIDNSNSNNGVQIIYQNEHENNKYENVSSKSKHIEYQLGNIHIEHTHEIRNHIERKDESTHEIRNHIERKDESNYEIRNHIERKDESKHSNHENKSYLMNSSDNKISTHHKNEIEKKSILKEELNHSKNKLNSDFHESPKKVHLSSFADERNELHNENISKRYHSSYEDLNISIDHKKESILKSKNDDLNWDNSDDDSVENHKEKRMISKIKISEEGKNLNTNEFNINTSYKKSLDTQKNVDSQI